MTQRSYADVIALLADNTTRNVSEGDLRDVVDSILPSLGAISLTTPALTTIATVSTPVFAGTTSLRPGGRNFDMPGNNQLRYTGAVPATAKIHCGLSMTAAANNKLLAAYLAVNGTVVAETEQEFQKGTGADIGALFVGGLLELATNDIVSLYVENETDSADITIVQMHLGAIGIIQ